MAAGLTIAVAQMVCCGFLSVGHAQIESSPSIDASTGSEPVSGFAAAGPIKLAAPPAGECILDAAGLINETDSARIRKICKNTLANRGVPIMVATIDSMAELGGADMQVETFARLLFDQWAIANGPLDSPLGKPANNGVLLLIAKNDRKARIELGAKYGRSKDREAQQVMDEAIIPHFKKGEFSAGILAGVQGIRRLVQKEKPAALPVSFLLQVPQDGGPPPLAPRRTTAQPGPASQPRAEVSDPRDFSPPRTGSTGAIDLAPPGEREFILDQAGLINEADAARIREICDKLLTEKATPIIVVTIDSMSAHGGAGMRIETFAHLLFDQWGIGHERLGDQLWNTGMLLLVSAGDRKARIELGAHWKRDKDAEAQQIMDELIIPKFRAGDFSAGILAGVEGMNNIARDLALPTVPRPWWHYAAIVGFVALMIFTVISLIRRGSSGWAWLLWAAVFSIIGYLLYQMVTNSGRSSGGGGFSGGSFGGGFSGGGGATGSW